MSDIVDELRAACRATHEDKPGTERDGDLRWRAAAEIERLRAAAPGWQPMHTAPKDDVPVLLYCPSLRGHVAREIVVGVWRFDPNRRSFGYWVSDVGALDNGFVETGPWIEYRELHPERWSPLPAPPDIK
jgi:hypothetical protein